MCDANEDYSEALEKRTTPAPHVLQKCVKCKVNGACVVIRCADAFCRDCFKEYFIHKFRAMLGKNRLIFPGEKVLLAVSGGLTSSSMLAQVQLGLSQDAPKKLRFIPGIVYVDEGGACGHTLGERQAIVHKLEEIFTSTGFPFYIIHLEQVFSLPGSVLHAGTPVDARGDYKAAVDEFMRSFGTAVAQRRDEVAKPQMFTPGQTEALQRLFNSIKSQTGQEEMLYTLRHHLIVHTARTLGYTKVMMSDSCTRLAVRLLSSISLGRGSSLAADTGFCDARYGDVVIVRPMRDYSSKEVAFYNRMFDVPSVFVPGLDTKSPDKSSIQRLTESFVAKLQADFPATVSTIYRTGEKLQSVCPARATDVEKCLLCLCALDTNVRQASAFNATLVSERLSQSGCCSTGQPETGGCCSSAKNSIPAVKSLLCYSCRLILRDMSTLENLPKYIQHEAERRKRRSSMKEQISEFLLTDQEDDEDDDDDEGTS